MTTKTPDPLASVEAGKLMPRFCRVLRDYDVDVHARPRAAEDLVRVVATVRSRELDELRSAARDVVEAIDQLDGDYATCGHAQEAVFPLRSLVGVEDTPEATPDA